MFNFILTGGASFSLEAGIIIGGLLSLALAVFHSFFQPFLKWDKELEPVSKINTRIIKTTQNALIAAFVFFAMLSFLFTNELATANGIAGFITGIYAAVWFARAIWQLTYLNLTKEVKPLFHLALVAWFLTLFVVYAAPLAVKFS